VATGAGGTAAGGCDASLDDPEYSDELDFFGGGFATGLWSAVDEESELDEAVLGEVGAGGGGSTGVGGGFCSDELE
jgi:hypothetical protein